MNNYSPAFWIELLKNSLGWSISSSITIETIRDHVYRLRLVSADISLPKSVIVKVTYESELANTQSHSRSPLVEPLLHKLLEDDHTPLPRLYWSGALPDNGGYYLVLEDISHDYQMYGYERVWPTDELCAIARSLARIHIKGLSVDHSPLAKITSWVSNNRLQAITSRWIAEARTRSMSDLKKYADNRSTNILAVLSDRYDLWMSTLSQWSTIIHGDMAWCNVGIRWDSDTEDWKAIAIDLDDAMIGIPQYDMLVFVQRGWNPSADWESIKDAHLQEFRRYLPSVVDEDLWRWGYLVAELQLRLCWYHIAIGILSKIDTASPSEIARVSRGCPLFGGDFADTCRAVIENEPASVRYLCRHATDHR